jgi:hypothetical protein
VRTRRLALASIAVVTVVCLVGVAVLAVAAGGSALAYEVNGNRTSQITVDNQLDDLAHNDLAKQSSHTTGSIDSTTTARLLNTNIVADLLQDAADRRGVELTAADRSAGKSAAQTSVGDSFSKLPESYRSLLTKLYAYANALGLEDDTALNDFLSGRIAKADVHVNPKYGFWNPRFGVCPPVGCQALSQPSGGAG